jgi:hypothetical protein
MAQKSARSGKSANFKFDRKASRPTPINLDERKPQAKAEGVSISLKYYRQETECFSDWSPGDLKKFSSVIAKIKQMTGDELRTQSRLCSPHKNLPKRKRFSRPSDVSQDLSMFEIRVDQHNAARIHGIFAGSVFHLVWLDRQHEVYPDK